METVEVTEEDGAPIPGAKVFISDANGAVVMGGNVLPDGKNQFDIPTGGTVTAFRNVMHQVNGKVFYKRQFMTVGGVPDGGKARLWFDKVPQYFNTPAPNPPLNLTINVANAPAAVSYIETDVPCEGSGFGTTTVNLPAFKGCAGESTYDLFVFGKKGQDSVVYGMLLDQPHQGTSASHTIQLTDPNFLVAAFYAAPIPAGAQRFDAIFHGTRPNRKAPISDQWDAIPPPIDVQGTLRLPPGLLPKVNLELSVTLEVSTVYRQARFVRSGAVVPNNVTWNPTKLAVPQSSAAFDAKSDPKRPELGWTLGPGEIGDVLELRVLWTSAADAYASWHVYVPPTQSGSFRLPALPPDLDVFAPDASVTDHKWMQTVIDAVAATGHADYVANHTKDTSANASIGQIMLY